MVILNVNMPRSAPTSDDNTEEQAQFELEGEKSKALRIITQEIKIVKSLASNNLLVRTRQLKKLKRWLTLRARSSFAFTDEDFRRIWKGLYYCMWMSDKPLVQEDLADHIALLLDSFEGNVEMTAMFFGAFLYIMSAEWFGIDQWRMDKFLLLVRRMLRNMFRILKRLDWDENALTFFNEHIEQTVLAPESPSVSLTMHFLDIFFEELAKVADGEISAEQVDAFVRPFVNYMGTQKDSKLTAHCRKRVFYHLLYQSALGREYSEKYNAWKEMGFPTTSIDDLERAEDEEESGEEVEETQANGGDQAETANKNLDPRAGNVDVFVPELPFNAESIIAQLKVLIYKRDFSTKHRKMLKSLLQVFQTYAEGEFPLGVKTMPRYESKCEKPLIKDKIMQLENLENEVYSTGRQLKQLNKRKRRRLLKSLNFDDADENNFDKIIAKAMPTTGLNQNKKKFQLSMDNWLVEEIEEEEVVPKKKTKKELPGPVAASGDETDAPKKKKQKLNKLKKQKQKAEQQAEATSESKQQVKNLGKKEKKLRVESVTPALTTPKQTPKKDKKEKLVQNNAMETPKQTPKKEKRLQNGEAGTPKQTPKTAFTATNAWDSPLQDGEVEYFIPSRKLQLKDANSSLLADTSEPKPSGSQSVSALKGKHALKAAKVVRKPGTPSSLPKRVKIALNRNTMQKPVDYIRQVRSSPNVPYDAAKMPSKGLLKPNSIPSPINPYYKKRLGLKLMNDTL